MKTFLRTLLCAAAGLLFIPPGTHAQTEPARKSMLTVHVGPSWHVGKLMGATATSASYRKDLRRGVAWDAAYWYTGQAPLGTGVRIGPGMLYRGSAYKGSHEEGSDNIRMHYVAPQLGIFAFRNRYQLNVACGAGYLFNHNKSTVYGNPRKVSMNRLACNLSGGGEYFLSKQWGVSAQLDWIISKSDNYNVEYHGEFWHVEYPKNGYGYFGQLSLTCGLNYHF